MSAKIDSLKAREILDSRGNPTLEVEMFLTNGNSYRAAVPSGASTGQFEAVELRDEDPERYNGKGVLKAVTNVIEHILPAVRGMDPCDQEALDKKMIAADGTPQKAKFGANAILGVSMASARAGADIQKTTLAEWISKLFNQDQEMILPIPFMNIVNGGAHASNNLDFQEFMIAPVKAESFSEALRMGAEIFHKLKSILKSKDFSTAVGDEGGFAPKLKSHEEALQLIQQAIDSCGYGDNVKMALDVAATEFFKDGKYHLSKSGRGNQTSEQLIEMYMHITQRFPIISIEDALAEEDWASWKKLTATFPNLQLVGDDLFVTQAERLERGIKERCANSILIKLNQVGSLTETLETMRVAKQNDYSCMISHRSGETEDTFIADLAVGTGAGQIKTGSLSRTDRTAKYNQLLRLEEQLKLSFAGRKN